MKGKGLIKGLKVTAKKFFKKKITQEYPDVRPNLPARSRGSFSFDSPKCIACGLCADACPNGAIDVRWSKNKAGKRKLDKYNMNLGYCLSCGLCVYACPTKALKTNTEFENSHFDRSGSILCWDGCPEADDKEEVDKEEPGGNLTSGGTKS